MIRRGRIKGNFKEGTRYGRLVVIGIVDVGGGRNSVRCKCDCGNLKLVYPTSLRSGDTKSCGCLKGKVPRVDGHGMVGTQEYRAWSHMKSRCLNPKDGSYQYYGARGISVCERWFDFRNFFRDMGRAPTSNHSLDRIDNDGNYEPGNCRWATIKEQRRNKRDNRILTINGKKKSLIEWVEETGGHYGTIHNRLVMGWSHREAVYGKNA